MRDPLDFLSAGTAIGVFVLALTLGVVVLVVSLLSPGIGAYYIGDIVQDESYGSVQIDENDDEMEITATSLLNAAEIHVRGDGLDQSDERTRLAASGQTLVITDRSDLLSADLTAGSSIELVILVEEEGELREVQTRSYELENTYLAGESE